MNYTEITQTALGYADREDVEVTDNVDNFLRVCESRINQRLSVQEMAVRSQLPTVEDQEFYGLPSDFKSLRSIQYNANNTAGVTTLEYLNPAHSNAANQIDGVSTHFYTIIANQVKVSPPPAAGVLEIVYHRKLPPLVAAGDNATNWLSDGYPEIYIFGLLVEISAFTKDKAAVDIWEARFQSAMEALSDEDSVSRWSGTPLRIRRG